MTSAIAIVAVCVVACIGYADAGCSLPSSCEEVENTCESGYYAILSGGSLTPKYCHTDEICGSTGWTRVAIADFGNTQDPCPSGLIEHNENGLRACKVESLSTPNSIGIQTGMSYSQVCGTVRAYQYGSPDAFEAHPEDIEQAYLDGVSVTRGPSGARQHVFSLAAAILEGLQCPCATGISLVPPSFVGSDYYCESGNPTGAWNPIVYGDDALWDGQQCGGSEADCCSASTHFPYFYKNIGSATTDDLELRVLVNQDVVGDENILLQSYAIYVK